MQNKNLIKYYIITENSNNINTIDIINNLKYIYNIKEYLIYKNIKELIKLNLYKIKN